MQRGLRVISEAGEWSGVVGPEGDCLAGQHEMLVRQAKFLLRGHGEDIDACPLVGQLDSRQMEVMADAKDTLESMSPEQRNGIGNSFVRAESQTICRDSFRRDAKFNRELVVWVS